MNLYLFADWNTKASCFGTDNFHFFKVRMGDIYRKILMCSCSTCLLICLFSLFFNMLMDTHDYIFTNENIVVLINYDMLIAVLCYF